jgi:hypothetical protein
LLAVKSNRLSTIQKGKTMKTATAIEITQGMRNFYGTEGYTRLSPLHGSLVCTDGIVWLAQQANCFWLIDAIASYQSKCKKDESLRDIQFWTLTVHPKVEAPIALQPKQGMATLVCERDSNDVAIKQEIEYTDFPLSEIKIFVEYGEVNGKPVMVCMLPGER